MSSYTLWIRLKECEAINSCIKLLGEMFNVDKPYKVFPSHITIVPSISQKHPNIPVAEILDRVETCIKQVKEELGNGKLNSFSDPTSCPDSELQWNFLVLFDNSVCFAHRCR